jgi:hypothetical protein
LATEVELDVIIPPTKYDVKEPVYSYSMKKLPTPAFRDPVYGVNIPRFQNQSNLMVRTRFGWKPAPGKTILKIGPGDYNWASTLNSANTKVLHGARSAFMSSTPRETVNNQSSRLPTAPSINSEMSSDVSGDNQNTSSFKGTKRDRHEKIIESPGPGQYNLISLSTKNKIQK